MLFKKSATPVNYYSRDVSNIEYDVDYAIQVANSYLGFISELGLTLEGLNICEIGPGINFGPQLILASHGASVTVADRFLATWDNNYHPPFYRALNEKWRGQKSCLKSVIEQNSYEGIITTLEIPAENLDGYQFDFVISNAVLEHVYDYESVCRGLSRITKSGGYNSHQIDFRDHRDCTKPLEFLLMDDERFLNAARLANLQFGNRIRLSEWISMFSNNGLELVMLNKDTPIDKNYLNKFITELRKSFSSYKNTEIENIEYGGNRLVLKKIDLHS